MQPSASRIKAQRKLRGRKASQSICLLLLLLPFAVPTETWQVNSPLVPGAKRRRRLISDPATEDMLDEVESVRRFTGIRLNKVSGRDNNSQLPTSSGASWTGASVV